MKTSMNKIIISVLLSLVFSLISLTSLASLEDKPLTITEINQTTIAWMEMGDPEGPPLLMIQGLGVSHKVWGDKFTEMLMAKGYRVIIFDNRDVGQSQRYDADGNPVILWNLLKNKLGFDVTTSYSLKDMAKDAVGILDHLNLKDAHILGASMGGMIAQTLVIEHPERARSLISIMSSSGAEHLPEPSTESSNKINDLADMSDAERFAELNGKGVYPQAIPRQYMAILDSGDRSPELKKIRTRTLVLHGKDDKLLSLEHGQHTAESIPGADFVAFDGMAHNIPDPVKPLLIERIDQLIQAIESTKL